MQACSVAPQADPRVPGPVARSIVAQRASAVVVTAQDDLNRWMNRKLVASRTSRDAEGGSAAPIAPDGYFLTANHVLSRMDGRKVFVFYRAGARLAPQQARVVWQSQAADLALLHIPAKTPYFYRWSSPDRWLPDGSLVIHGGLATGFKSTYGKLATPLAPEGRFTGNRKFKIDIPLQPGDSGGPVVDAEGALIGINSSVEFLVPMETAFFVDSEANRPNTRMIESLIRADRARNSQGNPAVD